MTLKDNEILLRMYIKCVIINLLMALILQVLTLNDTLLFKTLFLTTHIWFLMYIIRLIRYTIKYIKNKKSRFDY